MSIPFFRNNPNEAAYAGEKKHWTDVIKNSGHGDLLIWRQPEEDFNANSTLIVMPGEEAVFLKGGTVEQTFENGTYQLSTENYPFVGRLRNAFSGGISTFNCVVYFVRTAHSMEIKWGTDSPIQVRDKLLGIATKLRARGIYKIQIANPVQFLEKLVGNNVQFQTQSDLNRYFINEFQSKIRTSIAASLNASETELLGIDSRLEEFSAALQPSIQRTLDPYGLKCISFTVSALDMEDSELRKRYDEIGINATEKIRSAQADKEVMNVLGSDWEKQQAVNIFGSLAENPGAGGVTAVGAGIGMGLGASGVFGSMAQQIFSPMGNSAASGSASRGEASRETEGKDPLNALKTLKKMLDEGLLEKEEYEEKKAEIIKRM